jgi:hypothetical protein
MLFVQRGCRPLEYYFGADNQEFVYGAPVGPVSYHAPSQPGGPEGGISHQSLPRDGAFHEHSTRAGK